MTPTASNTLLPGTRVVLKQDICRDTTDREAVVIEHHGGDVKVIYDRSPFRASSRRYRQAWIPRTSIAEVLPPRVVPPSLLWRATKVALRITWKVAVVTLLVSVGAAVSQLGLVAKILTFFGR